MAGIGFGALVGGALFGAAPAFAAPEPFAFTVTSGAASGAGSLSEGLDQFEAWAAASDGEPGEARIEIAGGTTATLPATRTVTGAAGVALTLAGAGADTSTISLGANGLVLTGFENGGLSVSGISIEGPDSNWSAFEARGPFTEVVVQDSRFVSVGAVDFDGTTGVSDSLTIETSTFEDSFVDGYRLNAVTVRDSEFIATGDDGGTKLDVNADWFGNNDAELRVRVTDSRFVGPGDAIDAEEFQELRIERSSFERNDTALDLEGGVDGELVVLDSLFFNNETDVFGDFEQPNGSLLFSGSSFILDDSAADLVGEDDARIDIDELGYIPTRFENSTFDVAIGRAVYLPAYFSEVEIDHVTSVGGGFMFEGQDASVHVRASVFDTGDTPWYELHPDATGIDMDLTDVVATTAGAVSDGVSIVSSAQIALGGLGEHGGLTPTRVPGAESVLLDARSDAPSLAVDQRGYPRVIGGAADVGAVERVVGTAALSVDPVRVEEGGVVTATVTVSTPDGIPLDGPAVVSLSTVDGVAVAGTDYTAAAASLEFSEPGVQSVSIATSPRDGEQGERDFSVVLAATSGAVVIDPASVSVVIVDAGASTVVPTTPAATGGQTPAPTAAGTGPLANTGAEGVLPLVGLALALVLAGAVSLALLRRREQH